MIGLLLEVFGLGFYDGSVLHAKFLRALHPGDWVRTTGRVLAALLADADRPEVLVELRVESLSGVPAVTAVCFVPYRSNNSDLK
ncbi:MAG: hypothetical protein HY717_04365 [Planctomycetes bacterium]|nr:hypothetical protein [Planctomycetota bacterium]